MAYESWPMIHGSLSFLTLKFEKSAWDSKVMSLVCLRVISYTMNHSQTDVRHLMDKITIKSVIRKTILTYRLCKPRVLARKFELMKFC